MVPLTKRRHSTHRGGRRRSQIHPPTVTLVLCKNCQAPSYPHRICAECGYYNGKPVVIKPSKPKKDK